MLKVANMLGALEEVEASQSACKQPATVALLSLHCKGTFFNVRGDLAISSGHGK
jgi:hypothetical protein